MPDERRSELAYRAMLRGWGDPMNASTWAQMVRDLQILAAEYGENLAELVRGE
jgi:hypothetical protein